MNTPLFKTTGIVVFDPLPISGKAEKMFKPWWIIIKTSDDIDEYYSWFLKKCKGLILQAPAWGPHVSIVRGEECDKELWEKAKLEYNNKEIEFQYEPFAKSNGLHWWLKVYCEELIALRKRLNLSDQIKFSYHLTLGLPIPRHEEHSAYVFRNSMKYN